jgi:glycosyltransferase involved in cell wall biosynthesis
VLRVGFDVAIQGEAEPTGVERAQATLIDALGALPPGTLETVPLRPPRGMPAALWRETVLPRQMERRDVHLLHSPVAALPLRAPRPTVATLHELPQAPGPGVPPGAPLVDRSLRHRARTALAARLATRVVCVSARTRDAFCALHPAVASRAVVVHHAVDPRFGPASPDAADARDDPHDPHGPDGPYVLAVGRLRRKKNLATLLEAFARARGAARHRLVLAGPDGDAAAALRARARRPDLAGRVVFAGHVGDARLVGLYRGAALLAFPSLHEGFGLPVLEAMACGTPVVASEQGAVPEVRGEAAVTCDARDADGMARALDEILCSPARARALSTLGLEHARRFSGQAAAAAMLAVYRDCVRAAGAGAGGGSAGSAGCAGGARGADDADDAGAPR